MTVGTKLIHFSQRIALGEAFEKWAQENHVMKTWGSFVTFLQEKGMLNGETVRKYLGKEGKP